MRRPLFMPFNGSKKSNRYTGCGFLAWVPLALTAAAGASEPVVALGRLRPEGGMVRIATPFSLQGPSLIAELKVDAGQTVAAGELLARTHMHAAAVASVAQAESEVHVHEARLAVIESGLKPAEVAALAAETERERSGLFEAWQALARADRLRHEGSIAIQELEAAQARWSSASNRVVAASQRYAAAAEVREVDRALARAEVATARAQAERARRDMEQTEIRAPFAGEVIAIHAQVGEVASLGLLDLGRTAQMEVLAEVYESDVRHVKLGQTAEVRGDAVPEPVRARVKAIARQVRPNRLLHPDPAAFADNRVVEVILALEDSMAVAGLSGALVRVHFFP